MSKIPFQPIAKLSQELRGGRLTIFEIVSAAHAQIDRLNETYRAYSHRAEPDPSAVERLQAELSAGGDRGPLHGMTASVKGSIPVAGLPYTEGSAVYGDRVAAQDAAIVAKLRQAGAIILGTTTLSELAMYGVTNPFEPMGLNPWDPARTAGGSSTGAGVAAALGMGQVHIGTDSGGSLRNPACHCGVVGLMPRIGRLSSAEAASYTPSLSSVGLIGQRVEDVALAFAALAEPACDDAVLTARKPAEAIRLAVPRGLIDQMCDAETLTLFAATLGRLQDAGIVFVERNVEGWLEAEAAAGVISLYECGQSLVSLDLTRAGTGIHRRAELARALSQTEVAAARAIGAHFRTAMLTALTEAEADAFVIPTWPFPAPPIDAETMPVQGREVPVDPHRNCFVRVANACNACAISLPMGLYACAVPAGLSLMSGGGERQLLAVAQQLEHALPDLPYPPPLRG